MTVYLLVYPHPMTYRVMMLLYICDRGSVLTWVVKNIFLIYNPEVHDDHPFQ
jgi:hypothetical protein